ncbi:MAG: hypothetical protein ABW185_27520 [Sedimenticola sp.]
MSTSSSVRGLLYGDRPVILVLYGAGSEDRVGEGWRYEAVRAGGLYDRAGAGLYDRAGAEVNRGEALRRGGE